MAPCHSLNPRPPAFPRAEADESAVGALLTHPQGEKCRAAFEQYRHVQEPDRIERLIAEGEALLYSKRHPDPYIVPTAPGGCAYQVRRQRRASDAIALRRGCARCCARC